MIEVRSCARLHLGLLDNNGEMGRLYGSIGVAVSRPKLLLKAEAADALQVEGLDCEKVAAYAKRFMKHFRFPAGAHLNLVNTIPAHVGLGSGTQLALAVGTALARLARRRLGIQEIALAVGRGKHSGIGISTFRYGGFVLDGGHRIRSMNTSPPRTVRNRIPPLLFQHAMPGDWFFIAVIPATDTGLSGKRESNAFLNLPKAPSGLVEKISRVLLIQMLPALVEKDISNFGQALTRIQYMVGDCFSSVQGGRFANPISEKIVDFMLSRGAAGIGQSSWGPTVYGLIEGKAKAQRLKQKAQSYLDTLGGGQTLLVKPQNHGARISIVR
jgi:beta-ribofuranosylaminobenzene 5'-phosphate synthase